MAFFGFFFGALAEADFGSLLLEAVDLGLLLPLASDRSQLQELVEEDDDLEDDVFRFFPDFFFSCFGASDLDPAFGWAAFGREATTGC